MKLLKTILAILMILVMSGCGNKETINIEELRIEYAPMTGVDDVLGMTLNLGFDIKKEMAARGVNIEKVTITVASSYDDAALALIENRSDIAWLPAVTYCLHSDRLDVLGAGTLPEMTVTSAKPADWNTGYLLADETTVTYRSLIITSNRELISKIDAGEELKWDDIKNLTWALSDSRYSADGFMAPAKWLNDQFSKKMTDISYIRIPDGQRLEALRSGKADIVAINSYRYFMGISSSSTGVEPGTEYRVIGVSDKYAYDPLCYNSNNEMLKNRIVRKALLEVLQQLEGMYCYGYNGIAEAKESQYKDMQKALDIIKELD